MARTIEQITEQLETMVDEYSLAEILDAIADVCALKAEHVRSNWQDEGLARLWSSQGSSVRKLADRVNEV